MNLPSRTTYRLAALRAARDGRAPTIAERPVSLALERGHFLAWRQGGTFQLTARGADLLAAWERRAQRGRSPATSATVPI